MGSIVHVVAAKAPTADAATAVIESFAAWAASGFRAEAWPAGVTLCELMQAAGIMGPRPDAVLRPPVQWMESGEE